MPQNPLCVYKANGEEEAAIIASWLEDQGISTLSPENQEYGGSILGLDTTASAGIEVCVTKAGDFERAVALLADHAEAVSKHVAAQMETGSIAVVCESCHQTVTFPVSAAGSVQDCPHCIWSGLNQSFHR